MRRVIPVLLLLAGCASGRVDDDSRRKSAASHAAKARESAAAGDLNAAIEELGKAREELPSDRALAESESEFLRKRDFVGEELRQARETDDIVHKYERLASIAGYSGTFPEINELLKESRKGAVEHLLQEAEELLDRIPSRTGDGPINAIEHAATIASGQPALLARVEELRGKAVFTRNFWLGVAAESSGNPEAALGYLESALAALPEDTVAIRELNQIRRRVVDLDLGRADAAAERPLEALSWLERARRTDPKRPELAEARPEIRKAAATLLLERSGDASKRGLVGLAWVRFRLARIAAPSAVGELAGKLGVKEPDIRAATRPTIGVEAAGGEGDRSASLAQGVLETLKEVAGDGNLATVLGPGADPGLARDVVLRATIEKFELAGEPDREEKRRKRYEAFSTFIDDDGNEIVLGAGTREYEYAVRVRRIRGAAKVALEVVHVPTGAVALSAPVFGEVEAEDCVFEANEEAGVEEDPEDPDFESTAASQLEAKLADRLKTVVRTDVAWAGRGYYAAYRKFRDAGDADAATSWAVLSLKSLEACGHRAADEDFEFVLENTGYSMKDDRIDPEKLR